MRLHQPTCGLDAFGNDSYKSGRLLWIVLPAQWYVSNCRRLFLAQGKPNLNLTELANYRIAVPPVAEQHRIVAEVERRLSVVQEVEATVAANLKRAERLRQSILKRAFEGRLVPQDPSDEPAAALLERIRSTV